MVLGGHHRSDSIEDDVVDAGIVTADGDPHRAGVDLQPVAGRAVGEPVVRLLAVEEHFDLA